MNPVFNASSYQGITHPPKTGKENEGTGFAKKPSKSMIEGLRVHLAAKSDTLSIASARQNTGITEAATLSHREIVQEKGMASTTSVNRTGSEQTQLQRESETVGRLEKPAATLKKKSADGDQHQEMLKLINEADNLANEYAKGNEDGNQLHSLAKILEPVSEYVDTHDDDRVAREFYRCGAYALCFAGRTEEALCFFAQSEKLPADHVNLSEGLLIMQLRLGMDIVKNNHAFCPEDFYENLGTWSRPDIIDTIGTTGTTDTISILDGEEFAQILKSRMGVEFPGTAFFFDGVRLFRRGIRTILEEKNINTEASRTTFEQTFARLARYSDGDQSLLLKNSDRILKFARDMTLIKSGCFHEALESAGKNEPDKLEHLNGYICCRALEAMGNIDEAVQRCRQCTSSGYRFFSNYLKTLESLRK